MDLEQRLMLAQILNQLLKQDVVVKYAAKADPAIFQEVNAYVKLQVHNLLLKIMGEVSETEFTEEEVRILKQMVAKIKDNINNGAKQ